MIANIFQTAAVVVALLVALTANETRVCGPTCSITGIASCQSCDVNRAWAEGLVCFNGSCQSTSTIPTDSPKLPADSTCTQDEESWVTFAGLATARTNRSWYERLDLPGLLPVWETVATPSLQTSVAVDWLVEQCHLFSVTKGVAQGLNRTSFSFP